MLLALSYAFPLLPLLARLAIISRFPLVRCDILNEVEHDREAYRIHILASLKHPANFVILGTPRVAPQLVSISVFASI
jgi:hypothetical protein